MIDSLYLDYENSLIGRSEPLNASHFYKAEYISANQKRALDYIHYALEELLGWSVNDVIQQLDMYTLEIMKLTPVLKYINWPIEIPENDIRYLLSLLYPDRVRITQKDSTTSVYEGVLDGTIQFPREWFAGIQGYRRYCICLQHLIYNYKPFDNLKEMYKFFLSSQGRTFLHEYRLRVPADMLAYNLADCIYEITKTNPMSEFYHLFYSFEQAFFNDEDTIE